MASFFTSWSPLLRDITAVPLGPLFFLHDCSRVAAPCAGFRLSPPPFLSETSPRPHSFSFFFPPSFLIVCRSSDAAI